MKSRNATSTDRVLQSCCWALLSSLITLVAKLCTSWTTEEKRSLSNHVVLYIVCSQVRRELLTMEPNGSVSPPKDRPRPRWSRCSSSGLRYGSFVNSLSSLAAAEEVVHKSPISPRRSYIAVAVLCYVNLINYMERYTIAGWVISCAHMTTLPVKATAFGWPTRCFAVTQACSSTFRSSLISVTAWLHFCKQVWWCTHTPAAQFPLFVKMTLCNACCKWISQRSWHRRKCGITHSLTRTSVRHDESWYYFECRGWVFPFKLFSFMYLQSSSAVSYFWPPSSVTLGTATTGSTSWSLVWASGSWLQPAALLSVNG